MFARATITLGTGPHSSCQITLTAVTDDKNLLNV